MSGIKLRKGISVRPKRMDQKAQEAKLRGAAKMYEKQFLREMVKAMRSTVSHSQFSKPGFAQKIYQNQLDDQYAENWGDSSSFGLADVIYKQIQERYFPNKKIKNFKGPIPIKKPGQFLKSDSPEKTFKVDPSKTQKKKDLSYILKPNSNAIEDKNVSSMWDGKVTHVFKSGDKNVVELDHVTGLKSRMAFSGSLDPFVSEGNEFKQGDVLGHMAGSDELLWLKLFES